MRFKFKDELNLAQRKAEVRNITHQYPDKIPVIVERRVNATKLATTTAMIPSIVKSRFLVPRNITVDELIYIIRTRMHQHQPPAYTGNIFLYVEDKMLQAQQLVGDIYWRFKDKDDGFLYLSYSDRRPFDIYLDLFNANNIILITLILIVAYYLIYF